MEMTKRDILFSLVFHVGILLTLTLLNPFNVISRPSFESVSLNIIEIPLGNPDLIPEKVMPKIEIPEAMAEEEASIPIATPESRETPKEVDKPKEEPKPEPRKDLGYQEQPKTSDKTQQGSADGTDVSDQLRPGSVFGSATVDNASFNYPSYFDRASMKIQRNWTNPVRSNRELSCKIYFLILRSGTIMDPVVKTSSGVEAFDRACMRALQTSNPMPPLPSEFQDDIIGITLEFPYLPR
ncbi:MAG: TonB C-terminal domain-containing protein [candidate division Zixibacteria bacterium]|nr:TonB C-terminal domain-containing protein [candidate division Zixibacteria bacterium]